MGSIFLDKKRKQTNTKSHHSSCTAVSSNAETPFWIGHLAGKDGQPLCFQEEWCSSVPGALPKTLWGLLPCASASRALPLGENVAEALPGSCFSS